MAYDTQIIEAVDAQFAARRQAAVEELERRRAEVYKKDPSLKELDASLSRKYREIISRSFSGKAPTKAEMRSLAVDHLAERGEKLAQAGFPVDYLELKYECRKCGDMGFVEGKMCSCYRKALNKEAASHTKLARLMEEQSFRSFRLELYPEGNDRRVMERIYNKCKDYAENFTPASGNLLFIGPTGVGKTFLSSAIARTVIDRGYSVVYDSISNIIADFEAVKFGKDPGRNLEKYETCDLLVIDDLGTEMITQFSESVVYTLLNNRINAKMPLIVSTNLDPENLGNFYSQSIISRLSGEFLNLPFTGHDLRGKARRNKEKL